MHSNQAKSKMISSVLLYLFCYLALCQGSFTIRIRLKNGKMSRLNMKADSSFNDLHVALEKATNLSNTGADNLLFGNDSKPISSLRGNFTKLAEAHILHGDIMHMTDFKLREVHQKSIYTTPVPTNDVKKTQIKGRNQNRIRTLSDLNENKSSLIKVTRQPSNDTLSVEIPENLLRTLNEWARATAAAATPGSFQRTAVLLGRRLVGAHPRNPSQVQQMVEVTGLVHLETPLGVKNASGADVLTEVNQWLLERAVTVGKAVDMVVVGCFVRNDQSNPVSQSSQAKKRPLLARKVLGLPQVDRPTTSTDTSLSSNPADIKTCLFLRSAVASCISGGPAPHSPVDPFIILKRGFKKGSDVGDDKVTIETFHLSDQALSLHAQGLIRPAGHTHGNDGSPPNLLPSRARKFSSSGAASSQGTSGALSTSAMDGRVDLSGPVLLPNFVESRQVDSELLVVPVAVRTAAAATTTSNPLIFPSLQQMQTDDATARDAKKYLRKLLRKVLDSMTDREEALSRLRDVNLLLYLSVLLDKPVFELMCEHLRRHREMEAAGIKKKNRVDESLPVEVAVSLENLLHEL